MPVSDIQEQRAALDLMLYFAYGSNMHWERIKERCPSAKFVCNGLLPDRKLTFARYSQNNKCWTVSLEKADGEQVWGAVFEVTDPDFDSLGRDEGYRSDRSNDKNAHIPFPCDIFRDGDVNHSLRVTTFVTNLEGKPPPAPRDRRAPSKNYKRRIVDGAKQWRLPDTYIKKLEAIETVE